jgi:hypothetical protein
MAWSGDLEQGSTSTVGGGGARIFIYGGWACAGSNTTCDTHAPVEDAWELYVLSLCPNLCVFPGRSKINLKAVVKNLIRQAHC